MEKGARREGLSPQKIAQKYIKIYEKDVSALNTLEPSYKEKATNGQENNGNRVRPVRTHGGLLSSQAGACSNSI